MPLGVVDRIDISFAFSLLRDLTGVPHSCGIGAIELHEALSAHSFRLQKVPVGHAHLRTFVHACGSARTCAFVQVYLSMQGDLHAILDAFDTDGDGSVSVDEIADALEDEAARLA